jgi:drug/metabolite transporter (DMT)-like permease
MSNIQICGCVLSWVAYTLIGKVALARLSPLVSVTYACLIGALFLLPPALLEGLRYTVMSYSYAAWISIIYLGVFGTSLGFIWYYEGIRTIGPSRAGVFINLVPICAIILAWLMLNETVDASIVLGAMFVFAGIYLTNRS